MAWLPPYYYPHQYYEGPTHPRSSAFSDSGSPPYTSSRSPASPSLVVVEDHTSPEHHQHSQDSDFSDEEGTIIYNLKIINPKKKSQFKFEKFRKAGKFKTPMELRSYIVCEFENSVPEEGDFDIGYYRPSRGSSKVWIKSTEDMQCMYDSHKDEINLWCEGRLEEGNGTESSNRKRGRGDDDVARPVSKRQLIRDEVDKIFCDLKEKHDSKFTAQQYRLWANMLQMGTWKDTDNPPQTPMFGYNGKTSNKSTSLTEALSGVAEGFMRALKSPTPLGRQSPPATLRPQLNEMGVSPSKCASLRSQYIEQIEKLHKLLENTAITKVEYEQFKADILKKMKEL